MTMLDTNVVSKFIDRRAQERYPKLVEFSGVAEGRSWAASPCAADHDCLRLPSATALTRK